MYNKCETYFHNNKDNMDLKELLQEVWLKEKHSEVFILLYKYWAKPASTIAQMIKQERTATYKILQVLVNKWLISENIKNWVKHFFVSNKEVLRNQILEEKRKVEKQEKLLPQIEQELNLLDEERISPIPKMRFFEAEEWIVNLFKDILIELKEKKYTSIKCISANTFESMSANNKNLDELTWNFFDELKNKNIKIEWYLWTWMMTLEQMIKSNNMVDIEKLSVWNNSLNFFIVWEIIYLIIFKQVPFWMKLESSEFADLMHFMLKKMV